MPAQPAPFADLSDRLAAAVARRVGEARYAMWFAPSARFLATADGVTVAVPSAMLRDWLAHTFGDDVRAAVAEVVGAPAAQFVAEPALFPATEPAPEPVAARPAPTKAAPTPESFKGVPVREARESKSAPAPAPAPVAEPDAPRAAPAGRAPRVGRRWKALNDFVVGPSNRVAAASAQSVVEEPGQAANPLVIHGPTGTGKTHLLEGVYLGFRRHWPEARVLFVTAEEFTTRFVQASRYGKHHAFRKQFRDCSALLLDDMHFLATKRATQEEFLHTLDALVSDGRQVVLTTDCHPRLVDELMPELVDRLVGGSVWGVLPPERPTRLDILRSKSAQAMPLVPEAVLEFLAEHLRGNVRELEGALHGVRHFAKVTSRPVTIDLAREALGELLRHAVRVVTVAEIDGAVCSTLRLAPGSLQSKQRTWQVSHPRMLATFLARKHTGATYAEIARHFAGKTHSSAVAAEKKVRQWVQADAAVQAGDRQWRVRELLERIERELAR